MVERPTLTPLPSNYYRSIARVEQTHWWHQGMRATAAALLADRLTRTEQSVLDVGCGTGGYLAWAVTTGSFTRLAGIDISAEALEFTHERVPEAKLALASAARIPFDDDSFDLVSLNDVLQHIHEDEVATSLAELRRILRPGGALILRTNGARRGRRDAADWRVYDPATLRAELERAGFAAERITYANTILSLWGELRGRRPRLPSATTHGIPATAGGRATAIGSRLLRFEAWLLRRRAGHLPFGHTLLAVAVPTIVSRTAPEVFFDDESVRYDSAYDAQSTGGRVLRARLASVLGQAGDGPGDALDVGMGGGRLVEALDRRGWTVSGVDISERMVELARQRLPSLGASLRQADVEALPFEPESFDLVVATGVLEYANDLRLALGELARVMRPGGRIVVSFPDYLAPFTIAQMRIWYPAVRLAKRIAHFGRPVPQRRLHPLSPGALQRLVEATGLVVENIVPVGPRPLPPAVATKLDGSGRAAERILATQLVLTARRQRSAA